MPRADDIYTAIVEQAVITAEARFDALVRQFAATGMSEEAIVERMLNDLEIGGLVFGWFMRSLGYAGQRSTVAAQRAGTAVGEVAGSPKLVRAIERFGLDLTRAQGEHDPDLAFDVEQAAGRIRELMWVCELRKTCVYCLPLHGVVRTGEEWAESGEHPDTIHAVNNIDSTCYCALLDTEVAADDRGKVLAPLKRVDVPVNRAAGERLNRRTVRDVSSISAETSLKARDKLLETVEGRRALRKLGQAGGE
jgi:hypothetical protein